MTRSGISSTGGAALRAFDNLVEISGHDSFGALAAHRHVDAYAAFVLEGEYTELSADGKIVVGPGDVVVHPLFHRHINVFAASPVSVLNLILPTRIGITLPYARLRSTELPCSQDDIVHRPCDGVAAVVEALERSDMDAHPRVDDDIVGYAWRKLKEPCAFKIRHVAAETGVSAEHLAREFRSRYGLSPVEYRAEHRFRHALRKLSRGDSAANAALSSGYSDQSHMSRDVRQRIGMTPKQMLHFCASDR